ncbi:MAG: ATP-binding cassette domain-containing protein [Alphaproteobacteria bacterium]|nr:ATP-binding cassette domain-containing protein [Alphaproteobacteria bacterium SS10]
MTAEFHQLHHHANAPPSGQISGIESLVRFDGVGLRYGRNPEVLSDLTFDLPGGSFHYIMGPTGAGKSSLLKLIYMGIRPSRGVIRLFGEDITRFSRKNLPLIRRRIGIVFQDFRLVDHLTVFDNAALPLRLEGRPRNELRDHVNELLSWVGLGDVIDRYPASLSGGEQQRLAIARAVINRPALLIADEPTGNVDDRIAERLMRLFEELNRLGTTIVLATHNDGLREAFPHPCLVLRHGQLRAADPMHGEDAASMTIAWDQVERTVTEAMTLGKRAASDETLPTKSPEGPSGGETLLNDRDALARRGKG